MGSRSNSFLQLSVFIAGFNSYFRPLVEHLLERKVCHWDPCIRELASQALELLTPSNPSFMVESVLVRLLEGSTSPDLPLSHGATLAVGHVLEGLDSVAAKEGKEFGALVPAHTLEAALGLVTQLVGKHRWVQRVRGC